MRRAVVLLVTLAAVAVCAAIALQGAATATGDITPPVLVDASADRPQIDTSAAPQTVTFTLHITDDLSGFSHARVGLRHEHGYNTSRECQVSIGQPARDAVVACAVTWPQYSAEGRWMVTWLRLTDGVGNADDGSMATCERYVDGRCEQYIYMEATPPAVRAMEIQVGALGVDRPVYLPMLFAP